METISINDIEKLEIYDLFDANLYDKIISSKDNNKLEVALFQRAKALKSTIEVKKAYNKYKLEYEFKQKINSNIDFGENAPIRTMKAPGYYKDSNNSIRTIDKNTLITATLIEPVGIFKNIDNGDEYVKCAFIPRGKTTWSYTVISKENILGNGRITRLANKGVDVTSDSARLLVAFIRDLLNNNVIPEYISTSKMGWHNDIFLPYDDGIEFDGEDNFKSAFNSLKSNGSYDKWLEEMYKIRKDNVPLRLVMATSFASPLLYLLKRQSFVTMLWGKSGGGKTVAGRVAMSIWGDSQNNKLMFTMDNTINFFYRTADFFNHLPVFFDELQTYKSRNNGSINHLIMALTEGRDRGKAKVDGGTQQSCYWNNSFIMTGEESASEINSGGGTLNRLIEIYIEKDIIENGMETCEIINENYGWAGKEYIDYIKQIDIDELKGIFKLKYDELMSFDLTEEKQAINMAMLLTADFIANMCIFKKEEPLKAKEVTKYMFTKKEIDNTERAYEVFLDECSINKNKFKQSSENSDFYGVEYWGLMSDYEISIITKKLRDIMEKNGFNYNKVLKDWERKGYITKNKYGKYAESMSRGGIKGTYIVVKIVKQEEK